MEEFKRYFPIGSEWLYYKLYMGSYISEDFLISKLKPITDKLLKEGIIDKWFFINFYDPKRHIRLRFHLVNTTNFDYVIQLLNEVLIQMANDKLLNDILMATYKREVERYGKNTIEEFESLFYSNSELIINILRNCKDAPEKRWLWGMKAIDFILDNWGISLIQKRNLFESLKNSFGEEMGITTDINRQLSFKFRTKRKSINNILENNIEILDTLLELHAKETEPKIASVKKIISNSLDLLENLLKSYIHMHCNRLFSSNQRMNEWVVYHFLHQYYRSKVAQKN